MTGPRRSKPRDDAAMPEIARIGQLFVERRIALRLTQQALADLSGVSRSGIQSLERGNGSIRLASVQAIADVLGLHLDIGTTME